MCTKMLGWYYLQVNIGSGYGAIKRYQHKNTVHIIGNIICHPDTERPNTYTYTAVFDYNEPQTMLYKCS